jgi:phosphate transport system substrate-binding protein
VAKQVLAFFDWAYKDGDGFARQLDYVPLPDKVVSLVLEAWKSEIKVNGLAVWSGGMH